MSKLPKRDNEFLMTNEADQSNAIYWENKSGIKGGTHKKVE